MTAALWAYQLLGWAGLALGWPVLAARALRDPRYREGWSERLGFWGHGLPSAPVWVHGASVGEVRAASPLLTALRREGRDLLVTTTTLSGRSAALSAAGTGGAARLLPLDLTPFLRRALTAASPRALVVIETELWPALLWEARRVRVPCLLANARLSDRSFPRYLRFRRWVGPLLDLFGAIQAQSERDAERFLALGAPAAKVSVAGNLKFEVSVPDPTDPDVSGLRRARAGGWRVIVGGSTHPGEEEALLAAAGQLEARGHRVGLVLAPRHLERLGDVAKLVSERGRPVRRWSELQSPIEGSILEAFADGAVLLVDRYGLLGRLFGGSEIAFVGGSLAPVGGHNLLEPLAWGVPVLFGPHTQNAREVRDAAVLAGVGEEVGSADELAERAHRLLSDPRLASSIKSSAGKLLELNRGAVDRALSVLRAWGVLDEVRR